MAVLTRIREVAVVRRNNRTDWVLVVTMLALSGFGLLMIFSATRDSGTFSMERQMIFVAAGILLFLVASNIDYREYRGIVPLALLVIIVLLLATFAFEPTQGAQRWIPLGFFKLQPAEFAKVVVIIALAGLLAPERGDDPDKRAVSWTKVGQAIVVVGIPGILIYAQPDLGTTLVFGFILFAMLFVAGASWKKMMTLGALAVLVTVGIFQLGLLEEYQLDRIEVLVDPTVDPQGIGYNLRQSKNAIGSGQILGKGLFAEGTLTDFDYIPEQETDFIFTAVAEQLGFIGGTLVLLVFAMMLWRLMSIAVSARDRFGALVATGIAAMVMFHVFVNVGMTMGIMPVTGLPLPFLSQGGSFYLAMTLALGIANSVWLMRTPVPGENQLT
ncbi:MAG: rod shape-determining protein RodA [Acidimicrobiia bacterium]|nr:rod shape-determining protein RodA [Acidimicrobiia bacterium]